ncbi:hypothetical protein HMF7854_06490 [Sphingomonas ginkgonis]|uniref:Peptidase A2 domain-containing protein n=1 Tax=Sphingomonas ginkgonis TaxID=2315330 RepID=A0A429V997_9SPHN|nr:retropepsin-like aspartic protease [Sphingomonas ginkgonis]RST30518.1 hypothetical protein HMF7854_06490 [Sphingomonas ginkgonis]
MRLLPALALLLSAAAPAEPPGVTHFDSVAGPQPVDPAAAPVDVKGRSDLFDRMTVPVRIDGRGPYRFAIDTGADRTAISRELAGALRLPAGSAAQLHSVTGQSLVETVTIGQLSLAERPVRIVDAPLLSGVDMGADGLLGVDSLRARSVLFDFRANRLTITPARQRIEVGDDEHVVTVTARERRGRLILTQAVADGVPVAVVIDTGSQVTIANPALRDRLLRRRRLLDLGPVELVSVTGGVLQGSYSMLDMLDLGDFTLQNIQIAITNAHTFKALGLEQRPALLLGMNAMRAFDRMAIDFAARKLRIVLPRSAETPGPMLAMRGTPPIRP